MTRLPTCPVFGVSVRRAYDKHMCRCDDCRANKRRTDAAYSVGHKTQIAEKGRAWYNRNKDRSAARNAEWRRLNPEKAAASDRRRALRYYHKNKAKQQENNRSWRERNPLKVRVIHQRRRARMRGAEGVHTDQQLVARILYYGEQCYLCRAPYEAIDHVKPLARGGSNWPANLRPICKACNNKKWANPLARVA